MDSPKPLPSLLSAEIVMRGLKMVSVAVTIEGQSAGTLLVPLEYADHVLGILNAGEDLAAACRLILAGPIDEPQIDLSGDYEKGLFCGLEDRDGQSDPYSACRYGFEEGVERALEWAQGIAREMWGATG